MTVIMAGPDFIVAEQNFSAQKMHQLISIVSYNPSRNH